MRNFKKSILLTLTAIILLCPKVMADNDGTASSNNEYTFSGSQYVLHTKTDNGFSGGKAIEKGDPHYGWSMGDFKITGYTSYIVENDGTVVFLKNAGDRVKLSFEMQQDKDKLNDDEDIVLHFDTKAYDEYFQTKVYQHSMGLLVMQRTDYQNKPDEPIVFESFLEYSTAQYDKEVQLCEEGDYEVALDYELKVDGSVLGLGFIDKDSYEDYRFFIKFKVRNGNCMIFPRNLTGNELTNESYDEEGFFIDFAKSRYLQIYVEYKVLVEGKEGLVEDVRYNRPAADGEKYTQPGIYEITIKNQYTDKTLTKTIFVGDDPTIKMMAIDGMSLREVNEYLYPEEEETTVPTETEPPVTQTVPTEQTTVPPTETTIAVSEPTEVEEKATGKRDNSGFILVCAVGSVVIVAALFFLVSILKKQKGSASSSLETESAESVEDTSDSTIQEEAIPESESEIEKKIYTPNVVDEENDIYPYGRTVAYDKDLDYTTKIEKTSEDEAPDSSQKEEGEK